MIKESLLHETDNNAFRLSGDDANVTLDMIKRLYEEKNSILYNLPVTFSYEQIKSGGMFNSQITDCLIIQNPSHLYDYFTFCIFITKQYNTALVQLKYYGTSTLTAEWQVAEARKNAGLIGKAIGAIKGFDQASFDEENAYYAMLQETYRAIFL